LFQWSDQNLEGVKDEESDVGVAGLEQPQQRHQQLPEMSQSLLFSQSPTLRTNKLMRLFLESLFSLV
jgi:hypothetical protein